MNAERCLQILREIKDVSFATVDDKGMPQIRIIDIMLVEGEKVYFCTARGKDFYAQLMRDGNVAVTGMNKGDVEQYDTPAEILKNPATDFVAQLVYRQRHQCNLSEGQIGDCQYSFVAGLE